MKHGLCYLVLGLFVLIQAASAVTVEGFAYLEGETQHQNIRVLFEAVSPSAETDTTYTDESGGYTLELQPGVYDVRFSRAGYEAVVLADQVLIIDTVLENVVLYPILLGSLSGEIGPGTYYVVDTISVEAEETLTIHAGTNLLFSGPYPLLVYGTLTANGTAEDSILFTRRFQTGASLWRGIRFINASDSSSLVYCIVEYAGWPTVNSDTASAAVYGWMSDIEISNCSVRNYTIPQNESNGAGIMLVRSEAEISECDISCNEGSGIYLCSSCPNITDCRIADNHGPWTRGAGILCEEGSWPLVMSCTISGNGDAGIFIQGWSYAEVRSCLITGNEAGGLRCDAGGGLEVTNCIISDNVTDMWGSAGIACFEGSCVNVIGCIITGNVKETIDGVGAGVLCDHSTLHIIDCTIAENSAPNGKGGGVGLIGSVASIYSCLIMNNDAVKGGGLYATDSSLVVVAGGEISLNEATSEGGGVFAEVSNVIIQNIEINLNTAGVIGGGAHYRHYAEGRIEDCRISGNHAPTGGGVSFLYESNLQLLDCTIEQNTGETGGGLYIGEQSQPSIEKCVITGNAAVEGGGCFITQSSPSIIQSTFNGNSADLSGAHVYLFESSATLNGCVLSGSSSGDGVFFDGSSTAEMWYCDIYGNENGAFGFSYDDPQNGPPAVGLVALENVNGDSCDTYYNIYLDPQFVDAEAGDYHLTAGSPCIDAGDPELPLDPDGTVADIGAFYFDASPADLPLAPVVKQFALYQNYPNPFNSATRIEFDLPRSIEARLVVYDLMGRQVQELLSGTLPAGRHAVMMNGGDLSSGTYFITLQAGSLTQTRRIVLLK